ncbi:cytochrome P450 [Panaeolus papilionaceus]|nr:cytochrome P450 [Panaeolus papilionaceus]
MVNSRRARTSAECTPYAQDEQLYVSDPQALQSIIMKDQDSYEETAVFIETNKAIFGPGLVATIGEQHKKQRRLVTPIFQVSYLKKLTPLFYDISEKLASVMSREIETGDVDSKERKSGVLDMSEWMGRVALESVGRAILGYSFDPLDSPHNNQYTSAIKELIPTLFSLALVRQFAPFLSKLGPASFRRKLVEWTPHQAVQKVKDMSDVMHQTAQSILEEKRRAFSTEKMEDSDDKDIISILLRSNEVAKEKGREQLSDVELTGQMTVLIFGAQDTTSSLLSRILHLLSLNPDVQKRVRQELHEARNDNVLADNPNRLGYDALSELPWLDAVVKETLRLYPPVPFVRRTAIRDTVLPYSRTEADGAVKPATIRVPKGTTLFVSILGCNRLEAVWGPDAKQWKPERWLDPSRGAENPNVKYTPPMGDGLRPPGIYHNMLSFLGGGRSCVGYRFALIEMKVLLATLLAKFEFSCTKDEVVWNLSQIIGPSVKIGEEEKKGLPLKVVAIDEMPV